MTTPTADKLRIYYPSKYLTADNQAITQQTVVFEGDYDAAARKKS